MYVRRDGFTLAEVLVTLVIIGVIAALTIPALLQNTNQAELKTAFKKSLAVLNQAVTMSVAQDSVDTTTCASCSNNTTALALFFINKLNVLSQTTNVAAPYFYTADGMKYTVTTMSGTCGSNGSKDPADAVCQVLVDINGDKNPNTESSGATTYKDQYRLVVMRNSVLPGTNASYTVATNALQQ